MNRWLAFAKRVAVPAIPLSLYALFGTGWLAIVLVVLTPLLSQAFAAALLAFEIGIIVASALDVSETSFVQTYHLEIRCVAYILLTGMFAIRKNTFAGEATGPPVSSWMQRIRRGIVNGVIAPIAGWLGRAADALRAVSSALSSSRPLAADLVHAAAPGLRRGLGWTIALLAASLVFRDVPKALVCGWIVALFLLRMSLPLRERPRSSWGARIGTALVLLLSLGVSIAILETGLRLLRPFTVPTDLVVDDPDYFVKLPPNGSAILPYKVDAETMAELEVRTSSQGFRDREFGPKHEDEYRVLLLGDSFTFGHGLKDFETISRQLESYLEDKVTTKHVTVINGGVIRYSPWQERGLLHERGFALEPDLVIVQIYPANDIANTLARDGKLLRAYSMQQVIWGREKFYRDNWQVRANYWLSANSALFRNVCEVLDRHALLVRFLDRLAFLRPSELHGIPDSVDRPDFMETSLYTWYATLEDGWKLLEEDVMAMRQDCLDRGIDFMAYTVPDIHSVCEWAWVLDLSDVEHPEIYRKGKDVQVAHDFFSREGIPYIDLYTPFQEHAEPCKLYLFYDWHFSSEGARVAAQTIGDYLLQTVFAGATTSIVSEDAPDGELRE